MPRYLYFILIYLLVIAIAILAFWLVSKAITLFFKVKSEQTKSLSFPIIKGLTVLLAVYLVRDQYSAQILTYIFKAINEVFNTNIQVPKSNQSNTVETIVLYIIVGVIVVVYILTAYTKKEVLATAKEILKEEKLFVKIEFPSDPVAPSPIFHERIKRLFELKFEKESLKLFFDKEYSVLYGTSVYGLHRYCKIIYCTESIAPRAITSDSIDQVFNRIKELPQKYKFGSSEDIIEYYYLLENGSFHGTSSNSIQCFTESRFSENLIDFSKYLEKLIYNFKSEKLPFSFSDSDENKFSLNDTFIAPKYKVNNTTGSGRLDEYISLWLRQSNQKHLVILGDYGMGKSTFMKYYGSYLAKEILETEKVVRYPIFISLTNTSPRHGGIDNSIGKFISDNLGVGRQVFDELVNRGKLVFLLDGFDEMGYIGTHEQRMKQLNAIWQLATKNNKIIISGRPSYFPTEEELIDSFNIVNINDQLTPQDKPYFERIDLKGFDNGQVKKSISLYKFPHKELEKYLDFIFNNQSILDLCRRPSMMHIIREMLPRLHSEYKMETLNASILMTQYIDHWISRQLEKEIVSPIEDKKIKKDFIWDLFIYLASDFSIKGVEKQLAYEISLSIKEKISVLNLIDKGDIEGFETEILSGYFIEIEEGGYRFVHKSFREFFVAKRLIFLIEDGQYDDPLIVSVLWSKEVNDFVYDHFESKHLQSIYGFPLLLEKDPSPIKTKKLARKLFKMCVLMSERIINRPDTRIKLYGRRYIKVYSYSSLLGASFLVTLVMVSMFNRSKHFYGHISFFLSRGNEWQKTIVNSIVKGYYYSYLRNPAESKRPFLSDFVLRRLKISKKYSKKNISDSPI